MSLTSHRPTCLGQPHRDPAAPIQSPPYTTPLPEPPADTENEGELEARMSLHLLQRIQKLAGRMECDASDVLHAALHRFLETEEARLGITPSAPPSAASPQYPKEEK